MSRFVKAGELNSMENHECDMNMEDEKYEMKTSIFSAKEYIANIHGKCKICGSKTKRKFYNTN